MALKLLRFTEPVGAVEAVSEGSARVLGGGTLLVRAINMGDVSIDSLVRLDTAADLEISLDRDAVTIGARVTMSRIADHGGLDWLAPVALSVGGPAVRTMATVGGNLHARSPYGDFTTALLALDAEVALHNASGVLVLPLAEFLAQRDDSLRDALIRSVSFELPASPLFYRKVSRVKPKGAAVLTIAALLEESEGVIQCARIAYGAMGTTPVRAHAAEAALQGCELTAEGIAPALTCALEGIEPADDPIASAWYRRAVLPIYLKRLLLDDEVDEV